ncbi:hypothetical protein [Saccharothrix sp.]|uniref:hypothetical protein n=1 Tax=Saccharothrix sp. TaxID=1873460 RepID=UPI0028127F97|nr:hypothetical protein [Saccharothrix sp.]
MSVDLYTSFGQERINAARLVAEAAALHLAWVCIDLSTQMLRMPFPTASRLVVLTGNPADRDSVELIEVLDADGDLLWSAMDGWAPHVPGVEGGWTALCAAVEAHLAELLAHATPELCGWRNYSTEVDDPADAAGGGGGTAPEDGELYLVLLPVETDDTPTADGTATPTLA